MNEVAVHEAVAHLAPLLGTWRGRGAGQYPTIDSFEYLEEVTFGHVGKPFLAYGQKTRHAETELPMHAESGYWRGIGPDSLEVVLAHPTGVLEALAGPLTMTSSGFRANLDSSSVGLTPSAVQVDQISRRFTLDGDILHYTVAMAAVGVELTHHLEATLYRIT